MAKPKRMSTADLFETVVIDLYGHDYELKEPTRSMEEKQAAGQAKLRELVAERVLEVREEESIDPDVPDDEVELPYDKDFSQKQMEISCDLLDLVLEPRPAEGETATHAKTLIMRMYKADEIGVATLERIVSRINELVNGKRPT